MDHRHRQQSPRGNRRKRRDDLHHMSTSSLPGSPEGFYGGPPPTAPSVPAPPYNNNTYSVPHSPISSNESIGMYPPAARLGHMHHHLPPHHGYPSAPAPPPGIRGGDAGHMYGGRNTQAGNKQNVIHQQPPPHMQESGPEFDFRAHPRAPLAHVRSRSSSRTRNNRDLSPPGSAGGTLCYTLPDIIR